MRIFLAIAAAALLVPAAVAGAAVESVVVVDYDLAAGEQPEGVAVDKRGDVYVSLAPLGQVWRSIATEPRGCLRRSCLPAPVTASSAWLSTRPGTCTSQPRRSIPPRASTRSPATGHSRDYVEQKQSSFRTA